MSLNALNIIYLCFSDYLLFCVKSELFLELESKLVILEMMRRKTTSCLILQDMFRIHHPSSVASTE